MEELEKSGLLLTIDKPVDKDTLMTPLVRWQFRGGLDEADRKAFDASVEHVRSLVSQIDL